MCEFNKDDVLSVSKAIMENYFSQDMDRDNNYEYYCLFCGEIGQSGWNIRISDPSLIKHLPNCPVLIARYILTLSGVDYEK